MPVMNCAGQCGRLISVSAIPGGNPTALADPEHWAVQWRHCKTCGKYWCDRCWSKYPSITQQQLCPNDGKSLIGPSTDHAINMVMPKPAAVPAGNAAGPGKIAFGIFAGITGYHVLMFLLGLVGLHLIPPGAYQAIQAVESLVRFVGWIFFAVWVYRATAALRAAGEKTTYSPGMAVGGWFIPIAFFFIPFIAVRDVCKRTLPAEMQWMVPVWWISYWVSTVFTSGQQYIWRVMPHIPGIGYLPFIFLLGAYGLWAAIMFLNTRESQAGAPVPA